jgi:hypothetical protein
MWLVALKGLASNGKSTSSRFTINIANKQATGAIKFMFQNETELKQIAANAASGGLSLGRA